jgi:hypothetical protein
MLLSDFVEAYDNLSNTDLLNSMICIINKVDHTSVEYYLKYDDMGFFDYIIDIAFGNQIRDHEIKLSAFTLISKLIGPNTWGFTQKFIEKDIISQILSANIFSSAELFSIALKTFVKLSKFFSETRSSLFIFIDPVSICEWVVHYQYPWTVKYVKKILQLCIQSCSRDIFETLLTWIESLIQTGGRSNTRISLHLLSCLCFNGEMTDIILTKKIILDSAISLFNLDVDCAEASLCFLSQIVLFSEALPFDLDFSHLRAFVSEGNETFLIEFFQFIRISLARNKFLSNFQDLELLKISRDFSNSDKNTTIKVKLAASALVPQLLMILFINKVMTVEDDEDIIRLWEILDFGCDAVNEASLLCLLHLNDNGFHMYNNFSKENRETLDHLKKGSSEYISLLASTVEMLIPCDMYTLNN